MSDQLFALLQPDIHIAHEETDHDQQTNKKVRFFEGNTSAKKRFDVNYDSTKIWGNMKAQSLFLSLFLYMMSPSAVRLTLLYLPRHKTILDHQTQHLNSLLHIMTTASSLRL